MIIIGFFIALLLLVLILIAKSTYLVHQAQVVIIERFGEFRVILRSGLNFIVPFVDQPRLTMWTFAQEDSRGKNILRYNELVERIDLREAVYDFPKQNVITRDNVTIEINALLYYQITDPRAAVYEVSNLPLAIEKLTQTTLRNIIGSLDLDETLTSRDRINEKLREILDDATDKWGVKINRVELQEINPPHDIRAAMEKQMRAERDRRALILEAEGSKTAAILESEGINLSQITKAKGEAESRMILATAEAEARTILAHAEAAAINALAATMPGQNPMPYIIAQNYLKVLPQMLQDKNGKVIMVPYEATALMGSLTSIKELFKAE